MIALKLNKLLLPLAVATALTAAQQATAAVYVQCPGDTDGDAVPDAPGHDPAVKCMHLAAGDGFSTMADGKVVYGFGFSDVTGVPSADALSVGLLAANFSAPTIELKEGDKFYLTLTNVGMLIRPDLFDPHTVHFHGFPNQAPVFDGMPEGSFGINMGASVTYFYNITEAGTFIYHCHMEATEHMQMGMLGNLFVRPAQDGTLIAGYTRFSYNDGDGSTGYHKAYPLQLGSLDHNFHDASEAVQPLPFAEMRDTYTLFNGRGYPDTVNPDALPTPLDPDTLESKNLGNESQKISSAVTIDRASGATKLLLRFSNLNVTNYYTVTALGLPMRVVGGGAHIARGPDPDGAGPLQGKDLYYDTGSVTLGGGEAVDVIVDTAGLPAGTYFLYTTNFNYLSNNDEDFGGMMTEIVVQN